MMLIDNKFDMGQIVFLKTDPDQLPRVVTRFTISKESIVYELSSGTHCSCHYDFEINETKDVILATTE